MLKHICITEVLLIDCDKDAAEKVRSRLERALKDFVMSHGLASEVKFKFQCATYPDDAETHEDLINRAKNF